MPNPDVEVLKAVFSAASWRSEIATGIVVLGVSMELIRLVLFSKGMSRTEKMSIVPGTLFVVLGVASE